jgi:hypothetical protein
MKTVLNLLTRDGACYMAFSPHLTAEQYAELMAIAERSDTDKRLQTEVEVWARAIGIRFSLDETKEPA